MSFALALKNFGIKTQAKADLRTRKLLLDITTGVILNTPVDTGRARGNWFASVGSPARGTTDRVDPTGAQAIAAAQSAIVRGPGNVWYLTNNLPYIARLEYDGYSSKAPQGMVRLTLQNLRI